jgi:hypothetical protein
MVFNLSIFAQQTINTSDFLSNNFLKLKSNTDSLSSSFSDINYKIPLIKDLQFRTETKDLRFKRQEYTLRLKPNSIKSIQKNNTIFLNKIEKFKLENQLVLNKEIERKYFLIINYIFSERIITSYKQRKIQLEDKLNILGQSIYDKNFDVKDLIDTEENLQENAFKLTSLQNKIKQLKTKFTLYFGKEIDFNLDDFILPIQILNFKIDSTKLDYNLNASLQELKLKTIQDEMLFEQSRSRQVIDYFQAKYGGRRSFLFDENFSLGLGINLPFFGNFKQKKARFQFDKLNTELAYKNSLKELKLNKLTRQNNFENAISNYQIISSQIKNSSIPALLETYKKMEGISPLVLLKLEILKHRKEINLLKYEQQLYEFYLKLLATNGVLFQRPFRNYLTKNNTLMAK